MKKIDAIVYKTNAGSTMAYAIYLSHAIGVEMYQLEESKKQLPKGAKIIYMGWVMANDVKGYSAAAKMYDIQAVCAVGMSKTGTNGENVRKATHIPDEIPLFTLQGNFNIKRLHGLYRAMMQVMAKGEIEKLEAKAVRTAEEEDFLQMLHGGERVSADNLASVISWQRGDTNENK